MNRNRIIKPNKDEWMYIIVPVRKHEVHTAISEIEIYNQKNWKEKIIGQLNHYRKPAPYYKTVVEFLIETLKPEFENLIDLNVSTLAAVCEFIGIPFNYEIFSKMNLQIDEVHTPYEWALNICLALDVKKYVNAHMGQSFFNKDVFSSKDIDLHFLEYNNPAYNQKTDKFISRLSIIDMMMFNSPLEIRQLLDEYSLVK
jgi:hypothetical protein